jgi:predicted transcriptional regulator
MTDSNFIFWAFLDYSQLDNQPQRPGEPGDFVRWGDWWHAALETFPVPPEFAGQTNAHGEVIPPRLDPVYRMTSGSPDDALDAEQRKALEQSRYLVVLCSPRSARDARVNEAVRYFKQLGRGSHILPVVVAGEPYASGGQKPGVAPEAECLAPAMRHPVGPDGMLNTSRIERGYSFADARQGRDRQEILAADFSLAEPGLEIARIQLLAGLIGVGFNGLLRREQTRRFTGYAAAQQEARTAQSQFQAAREQARAAQHQLELFQVQTQETLNQLEAARNEVRAAQKRMLESQNLPPDVQSQIADAQNKFLEAERRTHDAQKRVLELERQARQFEKQVETAQSEAREVQSRFQVAQERANAAEQLVQALQNQAQDIRQQLQSAQNRATEAQSHACEIQAKADVAQQQVRYADPPAAPSQTATQTSKRLLRIFAVLAALALFAAGLTANYAAKQKQRAEAATDQAAAVTAGKFDLAKDGLDDEHLRQALQKFGGTEQTTNRLQSLDALADQIPAGSISNALAAASAIADDRQRAHFQDRLLDGWVKTNYPTALDWACEQSDPDLRQRALLKLLPTLPAGQFTNTLDRLNELKPSPGEPVYALLFQRWATNDAAQAWDAAKSQPDSVEQNQALTAVINGLAGIDFSNALARAASLPVGDTRSRFIAGLLHGQTATNTLADVSALPAADQAAATNQIATLWAQNDPPAAAQFAVEHPELPAPLYREIALAWGKSDFSAATNWFAGLPAGDAKAAALSGLALAQATNAPASALDWLLASPETNAQPAAIQAVLQSWSQTEPEAAAQWLTNLPATTNNDSLFNAFITGAMVKYPDFAAQWTQSVTNDADRQKFQIQVARQWLKTDPAAATNWIDNLDLPEKIRSSLKASAR